MTALHLAANKGYYEIVQALINRGALVDARDEQGATPLHLAANNGYLIVVQELIRAGADVNCQKKNKYES